MEAEKLVYLFVPFPTGCGHLWAPEAGGVGWVSGVMLSAQQA